MISNPRGTTQEAPAYGVTWGGVPMFARRAMTVGVATLVAAGVAGPASAATTASAAESVSVIVREAAGAGDAAEHAVARFGGTVGKQLEILGGFTAEVPSDRLGALRAVAGVESVTEDAGLKLSTTSIKDFADQNGSLYTIANKVTGASAMWDAGYTGKGVDVAVIDSGVVPVEGFKTPGKVVYGPDLTLEAATPARNLDTYGHGTHMSSIIAGRDSAVAGTGSGDDANFVGMAPDARIVSIKVADAKGQTDVSQAIAAIDWVVQNRNKNGMNIRVLNLSFGTDGVQDYVLDPLSYAAEQAWHKGIVVVVAVGNEGFGTQKVNNPAYNPFLIAVGSNNANGTADTADDVVSAFSNDGDGTRNPDLVAPGEKVLGLRSGGSYLDTTYPAARIGDRLFRGSGTSQAAAVVSGAAALLIQQRPDIKPDQVKALLTGTANHIPAATAAQQGAGLVDLVEAKDAPTPDTVQSFKVSTGLGSLEAARGSVHVSVNGKLVKGEIDVRGKAIDVRKLAEGIKGGLNWNGMTWSGMTWSGMTWSGMTWSGMTWSGMTWSGMTWSGMTWSGMTWSGMTWSGMTWSGMTWSGMTWSGNEWA
ncbi:S8 family serine peptidase [Blastococcus sp. PRF04-17]|uniref:S8 family serine peptidase n=1 Tax=Blastococcus sp. PRF04-17 TaxID=2933797 RepID=UPI001FF10928|nr:S8 family serine peptidase [Blastococcus sp. PRF04-17]UOY03502.1 S8 family serine peptidase [Blastococcus sp. PRF04-17]